MIFAFYLSLHPNQSLQLFDISNSYLLHQEKAFLNKEEYLLSQYRQNRSINTIRTNFCSIHQFLKFLKKLGRQRFEEITCDDLSAYVEYEQDQGKKPMTVHSRLRSLKAFFNYHIDRDNVDAAVKRRVRCLRFLHADKILSTSSRLIATAILFCRGRGGMERFVLRLSTLV